MRRRRDAELTEHIRRIHADSGGIYGSPRVHAQLKREGVHAGRKRVERLMRQADLQGISPRPTKSCTRRAAAGRPRMGSATRSAWTIPPEATKGLS
ncbi:IS3 family transposase [Streptomyces lavendulocolor]|uniref:IS3 family transposase n=1 Tax=Streptomyces lavendulocolor TaxID=67316 RepID=UPI003F4CEA0B